MDSVAVQVETTGAMEKLSLQGLDELVRVLQQSSSLSIMGAVLVKSCNSSEPAHKQLHSNITRIAAALIETGVQDLIAEHILPALPSTVLSFGDAGDVMESVMGVFAALAKVDSCMRSMLDNGDGQTVIDAMQKHPNSQAIQLQCLRCVHSLVQVEQGRRLFVTEEVLPVVVGPLKLFPQQSDIQQQGCAILMHISDDQANRSLVCRHGALGILMETLKHSTDTRVLLPAMSALLELSEEDDAKKQLSEQGAVRDLLLARQTAPMDEPNLRRSLAATLANLACLRDLDKHKVDFLECGGVGCLMDVLLLHTSDIDMQTRVTTALWEL